MDVHDIIKEYLVKYKYDGLYNTDGKCACVIEDLAPCCGDISKCEPGDLAKCDCGDCKFHISKRVENGR